MSKWSCYLFGADAVQVALTSVASTSDGRQDELESASASAGIILSSTRSSSDPQVQNTFQQQRVRDPDDKEVRLVMDQAKCSREEAIAALKTNGNDIVEAIASFEDLSDESNDGFVFDEDHGEHKMEISQVKEISASSSEPAARPRTLSNSTSRSFFSYITDSMPEIPVDGFWTSSSSSQKTSKGQTKKLPKKKGGPAGRSNFSWTNSSASVGNSTDGSFSSPSYQHASEHSVDSSEAEAMPKPIKRGMSVMDAVSSYVTRDGVFEAERNAFLQAAEEGNVTMVQHLLTHPDFNVNRADRKDNMTPVYLAASKNHIAVLRLLLAHPKLNINKATNAGRTPLYIACEEGHLDVVSLFLGLGDFVQINVNQPNRDNDRSFFSLETKKDVRDRMTPLYRACDKEHVEIVKLLLTHPQVKVNQEDNSGKAPLHVTIAKTSDEGKEVLRKLLAHPTINVNQIDYETGWTPLFQACYKGFVDRARMLLDHAKIEVNKMTQADKSNFKKNQWDDYSQSPLHVACLYRHEDIVKMLLSKPHINVNQMVQYQVGFRRDATEFQATVLHRACEKGDTKIVEMLVSHPAIDINKSRYSHKNGDVSAPSLPSFGASDGYTAFHLACQAGHSQVVQFLLSTGKVSVNGKTAIGLLTWAKTALWLAAAGGHGEVVQILLDRPDVDVNIPAARTGGSKHDSPMYIASEREHLEVVKKFLAHSQININEALFYASKLGFVEYVESYLKDEKIDVNIRGKSGWAPLHVACGNNHIEVVRHLLAHPNIEVNGGANRSGLGDIGYLRSPIHFAKKVEIIRLLLEHPDIDPNSLQRTYYPKSGDSDLDSDNPPPETRLYQAAIANKPDIVELLLSHPKINVHDGGHDILFKVAKKGFADVVKLLIMHPQIERRHRSKALAKASYNDIWNSESETKRVEVVKVLLSHPDIDVNFNNDPIAFGTSNYWFPGTPLQLACHDGYALIVKELLFHPEIDVNRTTKKFADTALWWACCKGHVEIARLLLFRPEIDVSKKDGFFGTFPLTVAKRKAIENRNASNTETSAVVTSTAGCPENRKFNIHSGANLKLSKVEKNGWAARGTNLDDYVGWRFTTITANGIARPVLTSNEFNEAVNDDEFLKIGDIVSFTLMEPHAEIVALIENHMNSSS